MKLYKKTILKFDEKYLKNLMNEKNKILFKN